MPELRWILIVGGAALLVAIYLWGRRSSSQSAVSEDALLRMPEPAREPHSAYVFRDEPVTDVPAEPVQDFPVVELSDLEPISANRRHRSSEPVASIDDDVAEDVASAAMTPVASRDRETRRTRIEPTLGDVVTGDDEPITHVPAPVETAAPAAIETASTASPAPTLQMSNTPPTRRSERRKIIALRIAAGAPQRLAGDQLLDAMLAEGLQHGKYEVFHRLDDGGATLFSVASMVEPGTFAPERMRGESYPGITMFTQFPGPAESMHAFDALVGSARRLHEKLGGTLQDERGVPLTIHRIERLRQDIREFDLSQSRDARTHNDVASATPH